MKKLFAIISLLSALASASGPSIRGLHCGTRGTLLGTIASDFVIPDYFPPEHFLVRLFLAPFVDLSICDDGGPAYLGETCMHHDECYGVLGASKTECDENMIAGWQDACAQRYQQDGGGISSMCLDLCTDSVNTMYDIFNYDDGSFCPSCIAFENSQSEAREKADR